MIRKANSNDIVELVKLFENYRIFYEMKPDIEGSTNFLLERIHNNESIIWLKIEQNLPVGFVQLYPLFSSTRLKRLWLLNDLYILPSYRGKGYSKELINTAKEYCISKNGCGLQLETSKTNLIGNNLYLSEGFELDEDQNFYFWSN